MTPGPSALHLCEILYRGRPAGSAEPPACGVALADDGADAFDQPTLASSPALTPEQATAKRFGLSEIVAATDTGFLAETDALRVADAARAPA